MKCDTLWSKVIRQVGACEICGSKYSLNAHHILGKTGAMTKYRHELSNGICLCSGHHIFNTEISGHGSTAASYAFMLWLKKHRNGQYVWVMEHKDNKTFEKIDYQAKYDELLGMAK